MSGRLISSVLLAAGLVAATAPVRAQDAPQDAPQDDPQAHASKTTAPKSVQNFPASPSHRLERAEKAFQDADYDLLEPLLEPMLEPKSKFASDEDELQARTLLGVGLYFEAQQVTDATRRRQLLEGAEAQFLAILRKEPDHSLNPLIYPASVVELFEAVREEHAEELDKIRAEREAASGNGGANGLQSIYIERQLNHRIYAANFMPFGVGQFQNGETIQGTLFAGAQVAALGLNITSYAMIESLRLPNGEFEQGPGNGAEQALRWRTAQYVGLGVFIGVYAWSVIDAIRDYKPYDVRIRTLDEPPPELSAGDADDNSASFQIGLGGLGFTW